MKNLVLLVLLLAAAPLSAQNTKGAHPVNQSTNKPVHQTRAVVVGISDYQNPQIPDLRFADRDAAAFADWLRSPAGGSVPESHLSVLLNSDATTGKIIAALGGLVADCKPGDVAVIYFSGHGDVERISKFQRGYWLSWDSPPAVYAAGACALAYLQDIISTLSESGVQVVVVADACRAGKLAGSAVGGTQATTAALAQQFVNEVKILSCHPEEFSLEGEQWGGGRGVFSYHLVDALYGMADANTDGTVSLLELGRYLEDRVPAETAPHSQIPFTVGGKATPVARVDAAQLALWKKQKTGAMQQFAKIDSKGLEELALADADSSVQVLYRAFTAALKRGDLLEARDGISPTADTLYRQLIREPALADLHGLMTRNFAAALMDEGQQVLNRYLSGDLQAFDVLENEIGINHRLLSNQFYRAAELLGEKHYYYPKVKAKGLYFESYCVYDLDITPDSAEVLDFKLLRQALALDSTSSHIWLNLCWMEPSLDSVQLYIQKLEELVPNWPIFHYLVGNVFSNGYYQKPDPEISLQHFQKALACDSTFFPALFNSQELLKKLGQTEAAELALQTALHIGLKKMETAPHLISAIEMEVLAKGLLEAGKTEELNRALKAYLNVDSNSYFRLKNYAVYLIRANRNDEAQLAYQKIIALDSTNVEGLNTVGWALFYQKKYFEMEQLLRKAVALAPKTYEVRNGLGWSLLRQEKFEEAEKVFIECLELNKKGVAAWNGLGQLYLTQKRYDDAETARKKYLDLQPESDYGWNALGMIYLGANRLPEAENAFRKATQLQPKNIGHWNYLALTLGRALRFDDMANVCRQAIALDSTNSSAWSNLGYALLQTNRYAEAEFALQRGISLNLKSPNAHKHLATLHFRTGRREEARQGFEKAIELNSNYFGGYLGRAYLLASENKTADSSAKAKAMEEALAQVELAIQKNATYEQLESDTDLAPLRALPEWRALMKKHFPDKVKD